MATGEQQLAALKSPWQRWASTGLKSTGNLAPAIASEVKELKSVNPTDASGLAAVGAPIIPGQSSALTSLLNEENLKTRTSGLMDDFTDLKNLAKSELSSFSFSDSVLNGSSVRSAFNQVRQYQSTLSQGVKDANSFIKATIGQAESQVYNALSPNLGAVAGFMNEYFGSNCEFKFTSPMANLELGSNFMGLIAKLGLNGAFQCLISGDVFEANDIHKLVNRITPKIVLSGDFKLLEEMIIGDRDHHVIDASAPNTLQELFRNFNLRGDTSTLNKINKYRAAMLTADRLKPGWRWQAHGEQLHASVYHTAQANQAFKDSLQASVMSQAIVFDPDAPDNSPTSAYAAVRSDFDACLFLMGHVASQQSTQTLLLSEYPFLRFVR